MLHSRVHRAAALRSCAPHNRANHLHQRVNRIPPRFLLHQVQQPWQVIENENLLMPPQQPDRDILIFPLTHLPQSLRSLAQLFPACWRKALDQRSHCCAMIRRRDTQVLKLIPHVSPHACSSLCIFQRPQCRTHRAMKTPRLSVSSFSRAIAARPAIDWCRIFD